MLSLYSAAHFVLSGVLQPLRNFQSDFLAAFPSCRMSVLLGRTDMYVGSLAERWAWEFRVTAPMWHYGPLLHAITLPLFAHMTETQQDLVVASLAAAVPRAALRRSVQSG